MNNLTTRRLKLERMTDIPDMPTYSQKWRELAADFRACGYLSNAALCDSKAQHYSGMSGRYTRFISSPVVILETAEASGELTPEQAREVMDSLLTS